MPLQIDSQCVGRMTKPHFVEVGWRESMNFAASIGDANPYYFDDTREDGIIAPPMLATALTWPIFVNRHEYWGMDAWPEEICARQVHLSEAILMHRPLRPEDGLVIRGHIFGVLPQRGGRAAARSSACSRRRTVTAGRSSRSTQGHFFAACDARMQGELTAGCIPPLLPRRPGTPCGSMPSTSIR